MTNIGIFHENFAQSGGAERVAEAMARIFPEAEVLTTVTVQSRLSNFLRQRTVRTTWMQALPRLDRWYRFYVAAYPFAVRSTATNRYSFVLTSCFGFAKGLRRAQRALHICYCHTPPRWLWRADDYAARERWNPAIRLAHKMFTHAIKSWDLVASQSPDLFVANSEAVQERLFCFYGRDSIVLHPPIDCSRFKTAAEIDDAYLVVSRLVGYKRIDLAIEACNRLGRNLKIIGDGPDRARLEKMAGPTVTFLGRLPDAEVEAHLAEGKALLFPGEEDFGLTPLEANGSGRPVIAYGVGGALETVVDGRTGLLFREPTPAALAEAILRFEAMTWDPVTLREHAARFDESIFGTRLKALAVSALRERGLTEAIQEIENEAQPGMQAGPQPERQEVATA